MTRVRHSTMPDWVRFEPVHHSTIVFVLKAGRVLLIRKKRGLGAGKINGPGGKVNPGESFAECARREVIEELCVTPLNLEERGELRFNFVDGYSMHSRVFVASDYSGEPQATDEAIPVWTPCDCIPYDEMWADDRLWFPLLLAGKRFRGRFLFDNDQMIEHELLVEPLESERKAPGTL
jgi:8-oxo-dGTP diphosphatase